MTANDCETNKNAEVTGKPHNDVMKAIRKMEPAWAKIAQGNFSLGSCKDANGQMRPCYMLTKVECLYIATKFNYEARAKLVPRPSLYPIICLKPSDYLSVLLWVWTFCITFAPGIMKKV